MLSLLVSLEFELELYLAGGCFGARFESRGIMKAMATRQEDLVGRVRSLGVRGASTIDLVAVGLSRREADAMQGEPLGRAVMAQTQGIRGVGELSVSDLRELAGLDGYEALRCLALIELGRRVGGAGKGPIRTIVCPEDVYELLEHLRHEKREHFIAILLDAKQGILRVVPVHIGTLTMSLVGPREVFREAIREGASSLIVAHNHPSGDPTPSEEDLNMTATLREIGDLLQIPLDDHVILGERDCVSLKEEGYL